MSAPVYIYLIALICLVPLLALWGAGLAFLYRLTADWLTGPDASAAKKARR